MDVETELQAIRYLVNDLIMYVYDLRTRLDEITPPRKGGLKLADPNAGGNSVEFDLFYIAKDRYTSLIDKYGVDIVNQACTKLNEFIKLENYVPCGTPAGALARKFIPEVVKDRESKERKLKKVLKDGSKSNE